MPPEVAKYLYDIRDAANAIEQATRGATFESYLQNRTMRDAVQWNYCVIGEALSQLKKLDEQTAAKITDYTRIIGLRNQLIHGYGVIDHRITWSIIATKLPILQKELQQLLGE